MKKSRIGFLVFLFAGIASTIWFIIRVLPKPSRAAYPCMKAAAPFMSALVIYIMTLGGSVLLFRKSFEKLIKFKFLAASLFAVTGLVAAILFFANDIRTVFALTPAAVLETPNTPIGEAKGIFPGRVVWVMDKDATNENCTNNSASSYWFLENNTNQAVIDQMLATGIENISGKSNITEGWDALFKYFNKNHSKGEVGYAKGEKIVIKVNLTTMGNGGRNLGSAMNITPQLVMTLLTQLIDNVKVNQSDITIGDPYRGMPDEIFVPCSTKYPNVHYIEGLGTDGREQTEISANDEFFTSDDAFQSRLPQAYLDAAYLINMPCLKSHNSAGVTMAAKNHQGSVIGPNQDATSQGMVPYLHYDYPVDGGASQQKMGLYRHIVDYMAHKKLGGNTLIYIIDAIWSGRNWDAVVEKWQMSPFNNDWTSSLFISQDPVALESVGYDFLYNEYKSYSAKHGNAKYPTITGVEDYIIQAADPTKWAAGIKYDPSTPSHTSPVGSLGVHEHWNNVSEKKYTRDLGTGSGIELYRILDTLGGTNAVQTTNIQSKSMLVYPNPVTTSTTLKYNLKHNASVRIELIATDGKTIVAANNLRQNRGENYFKLNVANMKLKPGSYSCNIVANGISKEMFESKILIVK